MNRQSVVWFHNGNFSRSPDGYLRSGSALSAFARPFLILIRALTVAPGIANSAQVEDIGDPPCHVALVNSAYKLRSAEKPVERRAQPEYTSPEKVDAD